MTTTMTSSFVAVFAVLLLLSSLCCVAGQTTVVPTSCTSNHVVTSDWEWTLCEQRLAEHRWLMDITVATNSAWESVGDNEPGACPACSSFTASARNATSFLSGLLSKAKPKTTLPMESDDKAAAPSLHLNVVVVDCSTFDSSALPERGFPCAQSLPAMRLIIREGTEVILPSGLFRGVGDTLGVATWIQSQLPPSYGVTKKDISSLIAPTKGRSMLHPVPWIVPTILAAKDIAASIKEHQDVFKVIMGTGTSCRRCTKWVLSLDAATRILNASGVTNRSVQILQTPIEESVWRGRWFPQQGDVPVLGFFVSNSLTDGKAQPIPLVYEGRMDVRSLLRALQYWAAGAAPLPLVMPSEATLQRIDHASSFDILATASTLWTKQLIGLKQSNQSQFVHVVVHNDEDALNRSSTIPSELDRTALVEAGLEEEDPRARHVFVVLLLSSWTVKQERVQKELNHYISFARRYDRVNNQATATFSVVDLDTVDFTVGSRLHWWYLGGDTSITLADVCLEPPCILTCTQLRARKGVRRCGGEDLPFNRLAVTLEVNSLEHGVNLAVDPTSDDELNVKPPDAISRALEMTSGLLHVDSLRPWYVLEPTSDLAKGSHEGRQTFVTDILRPFEYLFVLFHGGHESSANAIDYARRALSNFEAICQSLNLTRSSSTSQQRGRCIAVDAHQFPKLAATVRSTFTRTSNEAFKQSTLAADPRSPFIAFMLQERKEGMASSKGPLDEHTLVYRRVLDVTPEMLLKSSAAQKPMLQAIVDGYKEISKTEAAAPPEAVVSALAAAVDGDSLAKLSSTGLRKLIGDPEKGSLILFSGGAGCPHSSTLLPMFAQVAEAFIKDRKSLTIAVIDAAHSLDLDERKAVYNVHQLPSIMWYPKGHTKSVSSGELYRGTPQKLQLIEFVSDEMGFPFHEMDWLKDTTIPQITRRDFEEKVSGEVAANRSHTVLFVYRSMQQDIATLEMLHDLQTRFDKHSGALGKNPAEKSDLLADVDESNAKEALAATSRASQSGGVDMFKIDGRRFGKFLRSKGLLVPDDAPRPEEAVETIGCDLPLLIFLPRGPMKLSHPTIAHIVLNRNGADTTPESQKQRSQKKKKTASDEKNRIELTSLDIISVAQFIASQVDPVAFADVTRVVSFTDAEKEEHRLGLAEHPLSNASNVRVLDTNTFRDFVDDANDAVVLFYASWCKASTTFAPFYEAVAEYYRGNPTIQFGKIDVPKNDEIGHGQGILSFPTVKMYFFESSGKRHLIGAEYHAISDFLSVPVHPNATRRMIQYLEDTRRTSRVAELDHERELREHSLVELNETSLKQLVTEGTDQVLVEFYAPWCGHCRTVIPELQAVGEHFRKQRRMLPSRPALIVARIDATKYRNISREYNATSYPTILLFTNERKPNTQKVVPQATVKSTTATIVRRRLHRYEDHRLADRIVDFVSSHIPTVASNHHVDEKKQAPPMTTKSSDESISPKLNSPVVPKKPTTIPEPQVKTAATDDFQISSEDKTPPPAGDDTQKANRQKASSSSREKKLSDMYDSEADLKEVVRKRNEQNKKTGREKRVTVIEPSRSLPRNVRFLTEETLKGLLDTTTVVAILHCEMRVDEEHVEAWKLVAENLSPLIDKRIVVVGVVEASESTPALRGLLGEAPSITVFRGLATPQIARYRMMDPYEDSEAFAQLRAGEGGSGTNATEVMEFVKRQVFSSVMASFELKTTKDFEMVTQNHSARTMVMLYAPWSAESKALASDYDSLAQKFLHIKNIFITRVDVSVNTKLYERLHRAKLPMILVYDDDKGGEEEEGVTPQRKLPRRLLTASPTRKQLSAFLLNEAGRDVELIDQEIFVPYGDEEVAALSLNRNKDDASSSEHIRRPHHSAATLLEAVYPVELSTFNEAFDFVERYASARGALMLFVTPWCKHCRSALPLVELLASKVAYDVAVAIVNASSTEDASLFKKSDLLAVNYYPSMALFVHDEASGKLVKHELSTKSSSAAEVIQLMATLLPAKPAASAPLPVYETKSHRTKRLLAAAAAEAATRASGTLANEGGDVLFTRIDSVPSLQSALNLYESTVSISGGGNDDEQGSEGLPAQEDVPIGVFFTNASWCSRQKCGESLIRVANALHTATRSGPFDVSVYVVDVSSKSMKAKAQHELQATSIPSVVVKCNNTVHRFAWASTGRRENVEQQAEHILSFIESSCYRLVSIDAARQKIVSALEEEENVEVPDMSYDAVLAQGEGTSTLAFLHYASKCKTSPYCLTAKRLVRQLAAAHRRDRISFAFVDLEQPENAKIDKTSEEASGSQQQHQLGTRLVLIPADAPPMPYQGDLEREELELIIKEELRRVQEGRR